MIRAAITASVAAAITASFAAGWAWRADRCDAATAELSASLEAAKATALAVVREAERMDTITTQRIGDELLGKTEAVRKLAAAARGEWSKGDGGRAGAGIYFSSAAGGDDAGGGNAGTVRLRNSTADGDGNRAAYRADAGVNAGTAGAADMVQRQGGDVDRVCRAQLIDLAEFGDIAEAKLQAWITLDASRKNMLTSSQ